LQISFQGPVLFFSPLPAFFFKKLSFGSHRNTSFVPYLVQF
jgi:hypothetical protein